MFDPHFSEDILSLKILQQTLGRFSTSAMFLMFFVPLDFLRQCCLCRHFILIVPEFVHRPILSNFLAAVQLRSAYMKTNVRATRAGWVRSRVSFQQFFAGWIAPGTSNPFGHKASSVFLQNAPVHDHREAGGAGAFGGLLVNHPFLHPDHFGLLADGGLHYLRNEI